MKTKISYQLCLLLLLPFTFYLYSCNGGNKDAGSSDARQTSLDSIKSVETKLKNAAKPAPDFANYTHVINLYTNFATDFPNDSLSPIFLLRAATFESSLGQYNKAINIYDTISVKYPSFNRAAECMFSRANLYDDKLRDTADAHAIYLQIINKFPNDTVWAKQARYAISNLGKTPDQIIKEFEEKNKNKK
jgi:TolA-binding protein